MTRSASVQVRVCVPAHVRARTHARTRAHTSTSSHARTSLCLWRAGVEGPLAMCAPHLLPPFRRVLGVCPSLLCAGRSCRASGPLCPSVPWSKSCVPSCDPARRPVFKFGRRRRSTVPPPLPRPPASGQSLAPSRLRVHAQASAHGRWPRCPDRLAAAPSESAGLRRGQRVRVGPFKWKSATCWWPVRSPRRRHDGPRAPELGRRRVVRIMGGREEGWRERGRE